MMEPRTLTKFILTCTITCWAVLLHDSLLLALLVVAELVLLASYSKLASSRKMMVSLFGFSVFLALIQLLCGASTEIAIVSALRMLAMTLIFVYLMGTTKLTEFHHLFAYTLHLPVEYAFMLTSVFRFIPDLIRESQQVREAQVCRGYRTTGPGIKRLLSYVALIGPLVLRSVSRSENMAMALALRGYSPHSIQEERAAGIIDYTFFVCMAAVTVLLLYSNLA
jgi:energy-coupling factor transport system permease protein